MGVNSLPKTASQLRFKPGPQYSTLTTLKQSGFGPPKGRRLRCGFWLALLQRLDVAVCAACNCNSLGSLRQDCEQMTGRCVCRPGVTGQKCNLCPNGKRLSDTGCTGQ